MVLKNICILVLWTKVASVLEGLTLMLLLRNVLLQCNTIVQHTTAWRSLHYHETSFVSMRAKGSYQLWQALLINSQFNISYLSRKYSPEVILRLRGDQQVICGQALWISHWWWDGTLTHSHLKHGLTQMGIFNPLMLKSTSLCESSRSIWKVKNVPLIDSW